MSAKVPIPDDSIIAFVCAAMPRDERAALAARMVDDAELAARVEAVRRMLAPLEAWRAPEPSGSAVDAIMQRVAQTSPLAYVAERARLSPPAEQAVRRSRFTLAQFFAVAASIALLLSVFFPTVQRHNNARIQTACLNGMGRLWKGVQAYAAEYDGVLPRVDFASQGGWAYQPQRQHLAPAIRVQFVSPRDVLCPSTMVFLKDEAARTHPEQFLRLMDVRFYSMQYPGDGRQPGARSLRLNAMVRMPVAGDENPLFPGGQAAPELDDSANSAAHRGDGQNVLFNDGSAEFLRSPYVQAGDNIWRWENAPKSEASAAPVSATDSFLIP